jgi:lysozyme family protein
MIDIEKLISDLIGREGGYTNNPKDTGGPTCWGITEQVARAFGYSGDMQALPRPTAIEIYKARFWLGPKLDQVAAILPDVAAELFDAGVNMGIAMAGRYLQRALNVLNRGAIDYPDILVDGGIGAMTIAALKGYRQHRADGEGAAVLLWLVRALRAGRYVEIAEANASQETFEYGWIARQVRMAA